MSKELNLILTESQCLVLLNLLSDHIDSGHGTENFDFSDIDKAEKMALYNLLAVLESPTAHLTLNNSNYAADLAAAKAELTEGLQ